MRDLLVARRRRLVRSISTITNVRLQPSKTPTPSLVISQIDEDARVTIKGDGAALRIAEYVYACRRQVVQCAQWSNYMNESCDHVMFSLQQLCALWNVWLMSQFAEYMQVEDRPFVT